MAPRYCSRRCSQRRYQLKYYAEGGAAQVARRARWRKYRLTDAEYQTRLQLQNNQCAICTKPATDVDHDHQTGAVRGLLCRRCNTALGTFGDSVEGLERALRYLKYGVPTF